MKALMFCVIKANKYTSPMLLWGSAIAKPFSRTSKIIKLNKHWFVFRASGPIPICACVILSAKRKHLLGRIKSQVAVSNLSFQFIKR